MFRGRAKSSRNLNQWAHSKGERMKDQWKSWSKKIPDIEGEFYMRDESGGPTLYVFELADGVLMHGTKARDFRWEATGIGHLKSAEFKLA